jgi:hypothetical protein
MYGAKAECLFSEYISRGTIRFGDPAPPDLQKRSLLNKRLSGPDLRKTQRYKRGGSASPSSGQFKPYRHSFRFLPPPLQALEEFGEFLLDDHAEAFKSICSFKVTQVDSLRKEV